ncbi:MAG: DUF1553 domain-containing protein [Acidobacteria bacterium]|nr:DUF1553 domain-containing protein [Acidobacteriota bacterium]
MSMPRNLALTGLLWTLALVAAEPPVVSMAVYPPAAQLSGAGASQQLTAVGKTADGREVDLTDQVEWTATTPGVIELREGARAFGAADGETVVQAALEGMTAEAKLAVAGSDEQKPFSFARDIVGVFTRRGCNNAGCHGGVKGQAGFKLSNNGVHPHEDYKWIVQGGVFQVLTDEPKGESVPRINVEQPEASLLLQKATFEVAHGGGPRFEKGSDDYNAILAWIQDGAPYGESGDANEPKVARLEAFPFELTFEPKQARRLLVTAHYDDGHSEDFTHKVLYEGSDSGVATVTADGRVEAAAPGETAVMIKAAGRSIRVGVGVVGPPLESYPQVPRNNFIDEEVFSKLERFNILPSELASDEEFLRRVCLDLTGRMPPPARVREFVADASPDKRARVVDALLASPEYVDYWTFRFSDLFRVAMFPVGINPKWTQAYSEWVRDAIARDRPYDEVARERIAAQGYSPATRHYLPYLVIPPPENMMAEEMRVFMGRRFDCAQCHDHPYEEWTQDQFWGLTAFFGPMFKFGGNETSVIFDFPEGKEIAADVASPKEMRVVHPRTKELVQPALLDGRVVGFEGNPFPRRDLAEWVTSHEFFAQATANRIWSHFFGRGLVDPVDDFRSTNPPTHPALLKQLADDFVKGGYRLKPLMRRITLSRTYQLSAQANPTNAADRINYSHSWPRALDAEILLDAISEVTGVQRRFDVGENRGKWKGGTAPVGTRAVELKEGDLYASPFFDAYGRPNRFSVPERDPSPKLAQALHMLAGTTYNEALWKPGARVYDLYQAGASDEAIVEELYLAAFARTPTTEESAAIQVQIAATPTREQALQDLQWAILSSRQFAENH